MPKIDYHVFGIAITAVMTAPATVCIQTSRIVALASFIAFNRFEEAEIFAPNAVHLPGFDLVKFEHGHPILILPACRTTTV